MDEIWELRKAIWRNGMRPVSIRSYPELLKHPTLSGWGDLARGDPPYPAVTLAPHPSFLSTGILCDELQPIDIDLNSAKACVSVAEWCLERFGAAPVRYRDNAPRLLLLYRAAEGSPHKRRAWRKATKEGVEVLGHGLQFMAYGQHPSGGWVDWMDGIGPHNTRKDDLTSVTDEQVGALLDYASDLLGIEQTVIQRKQVMTIAPCRVNGAMNGTYDTMRWHDADIEAALQAIPNVQTDYDWWLSIGMSVFVASHGTGYHWFRDWSAINPEHDDRLCAKTWMGLQRNPPTRITGHTLVRYASEANGGQWIKPSRRLAELPKFY